MNEFQIWITKNGNRFPINYKEYTNELQFLQENDFFDLITQCRNATNSESEAREMEQAILEYTDENYRNSYRLINKRLNYGYEIAKDTQRNIDLIQKAIDANKLKNNMIIYRCFDAEDYAYNVSNLTAGQILNNRGFTSTCLTKEMAEKFSFMKSNAQIIKVKVKKGTNAIYLGENTRATSNENEILFGQNTRIRITSIKKVNNKYEFEGEML